MYKCGKVLQVSVGLSVDPRTAALVCALHRRVLPNLCMWRTRALKTPSLCTRYVSALYPRAHLCVCSHRSHGRGGCAGPPLHAGVALTCSRVRVAGSARRARAPGAVTHGLAEEAVTQCWIPAAPQPPLPGRSGHRGHVEPAGPAAGPAGHGWRCWGVPAGLLRAGCTCLLLGQWARRVPGSRCMQEEDAPGSGWHRARPGSRPTWAWGSGLGTFPGCLGRLRLCHPRAAMPGAALSSSLGGCSLRGGPELLHLPWVYHRSGLWLQLHLPLALSHCWHRALQLLWLSAQGWARVWGATVPCRQHCGPGQGQVAAEGGDQWCHVMPRVLCQEAAVPCGASGTALGVSGTVPCPGGCAGGGTLPKAQCRGTGSLCESEQSAAAAPSLLARSQALHTRFTFAMTGAATSALLSSA